MPTNLGALLTDKRVHGAVQIKRGGPTETVWGLLPANVGTRLRAGSSGEGDMVISYTPTYPCYWIVRGNVTSRGAVDGIGWRRWDWGIGITPADANGVTAALQVPCQVYDHTSGGTPVVQWRTSASSVMFKLAAGVTYTAYMHLAYVQKGTIDYLAGPQWARLVGRVIGEGAI